MVLCFCLLVLIAHFFILDGRCRGAVKPAPFVGWPAKE